MYNNSFFSLIIRLNVLCEYLKKALEFLVNHFNNQLTRKRLILVLEKGKSNFIWLKLHNFEVTYLLIPILQGRFSMGETLTLKFSEVLKVLLNLNHVFQRRLVLIKSNLNTFMFLDLRFAVDRPFNKSELLILEL